MTAITTDAINRYIDRRRAETTHLLEGDGQTRRRTANRTINIELGLLKRMLRLAWKASPQKLLAVRPIEMLKDAPPRAGFFEVPEAVEYLRRLPEDLQLANLVAKTFGWRMASEIFPLGRRLLDLARGTLRLDPGTTKNDDGRVVDRRRSRKRSSRLSWLAWISSPAGSAAWCRRSSRTSRGRTSARRARACGSAATRSAGRRALIESPTIGAGRRCARWSRKAWRAPWP